jgi:uncharacterized protein
LERVEGGRYRVLSLDGGGMRGIYTAAFLDRLIDQQARRQGSAPLDLGQGFDLIVGTSTGAIVACAAAVGVPMRDVVALYRRHGADIFPQRIAGRMSVVARAFAGRRFVRSGDAALRAALVEVLGPTTMLDVYRDRGISLSIPTVDMSSHKAWVFKKTPKSGPRDEGYSLVDVCMASSAAPIYRSLSVVDDPNSPGARRVFADGGLWANNPIMVGLTDALTIAAPEQEIEIYSLGTCPRPEGEHIVGDAAHRSMMEWRLGADVAPLSIAAQEFAYDNMARLISNALSTCGRSVRRVRFPNRPVPAGMMPFLGLDDSREEAMDRLVAQAHNDADLTRSNCDDPQNEEGAMVRRLLESLPESRPRVATTVIS